MSKRNDPKRRKNLKKCSLCLLLSLVLAGIFPHMTARAASGPVLSASTDSASAVQGQTIDIQVNLADNPAVSTLGMVLDYDSNVLQYTSSTWNSAFSGSDMTLVSDDSGVLNISAVCDTPYAADGVVITAHFQVISDSADIPVTLGLRDMTDSDLEPVDCRVISALQVPSASQAVTPTTSNKQPSAPSTTNTGSSSSGQRSADENFKTGAGLGDDIYLVIAVAFGILGLSLILKKKQAGEEK